MLCQGLTPQAVASVRARLRAADADMYEQKRAARTTLPGQRVPEPAPL